METFGKSISAFNNVLLYINSKMHLFTICLRSYTGLLIMFIFLCCWIMTLSSIWYGGSFGVWAFLYFWEYDYLSLLGVHGVILLLCFWPFCLMLRLSGIESK